MVRNIFSGIPQELVDEGIDVLADTGRIKIERIVSRGHRSADDFWYDQGRREFVLLIQGEARLEFEEGAGLIHMMPGDYLVIQPHERHRVAWTSPDGDTIWLAVHY